MIVCDTGPLVAAAIGTDDHHRECVDLLTGLRLAGRAILVPPTVVAEVGYLMNELGGSRVEADFLLSMADGTFEPLDLTRSDYRRTAELVIQYADLRLGTTDGTVIALAERLGIHDIATLDRRHFTVVKPRHTRSLNMLPSAIADPTRLRECPRQPAEAEGFEPPRL